MSYLFLSCTKINNKKIIVENLEGKVKTIHLDYLRNGDRYTHQGNWQKRFDEMLAERGIFPDNGSKRNRQRFND